MNLVRGKRLSSRLDTALFRIEEGRRLLGFDALTDDSNRPERNPTQDLKGAAAVANLRCGTSAIAHGAIGLERRDWVESGPSRKRGVGEQRTGRLGESTGCNGRSSHFRVRYVSARGLAIAPVAAQTRRDDAIDKRLEIVAGDRRSSQPFIVSLGAIRPASRKHDAGVQQACGVECAFETAH